MGLLDYALLGGDGAGLTPDERREAQRSMGLLSMGLGLLAANQPGASPLQAIGQGGLLGLSSIAQRQQQQDAGALRRMQLAEMGRKQAAQKALSDALGAAPAGPQLVSADPSQRVAAAMADRVNADQSAGYQSKLQMPQVQAAIMELYGPAGIAALRAENKLTPFSHDQGLMDAAGRVVRQPGQRAPEGMRWNAAGQLELIPGYAEGRGQIASLSEPPVKVLNPDGTVKYVPRSQAMGQSAPDEASIVFGPDGKPIYARGGAGAIKGLQSGLTSAAQGEVEKQLLDMTAQLTQVNRIVAGFRPEYQQIGTRAGLAWSTIRDKAGMNLDPEDREQLAAFATHKAEAGQFFADKLKAMSGGAVTPQEATRQETYLPNPGSGVFDGDSPTEFAAKAKRMQDFMRRATARLHYVSKRGMSIRDVPLDDMPEIIRKRRDEVRAALERRGLAGADLDGAVRRQLAIEFGFASD